MLASNSSVTVDGGNITKSEIGIEAGSDSHGAYRSAITGLNGGTLGEGL